MACCVPNSRYDLTRPAETPEDHPLRIRIVYIIYPMPLERGLRYRHVCAELSALPDLSRTAGVQQTLPGMLADPVREMLGVEDDMKLLFAISFGYADRADRPYSRPRCLG